MKLPYMSYGKPVPSEAFPEPHNSWLPLLNVTLSFGAKSFKYLSLVDSGAAYCCFPMSIAIELGIPESAMKLGPEIEGFGGFARLRYAKVELLIGGDFRTSTMVAFYDDLPGMVPLGKLGTHGFFDSFVVTLDRKNRNFSIELSKFDTN